MTSWFERQRNILDFTLSSFLRRKGKNSALLLVYTAVVFVLASVMFFSHAIRKEAGYILRDAPEMIVQRMVAGRHDLIPLGYVAQIAEIRGVDTVRPRLWGYYFDPSTGANYTLIADESLDGKPGSIIVGNGVSRVLGLYEEDLMSFRDSGGKPASFHVASIMSSDSELVSADLVLMNAEDFRSLFGIPADRATDLVLTVRNERELPTIAQKVVKLLPDTRPIIRDEIIRTYESIFDWRSGVVVVILFAAVLAFIIFAWDKASGLSAEERREIGILKAIGWETSDVIVMKFWEGVVVSLSSFLAGVILAYVHVFFTSASLFEHALKGWSVLYPEFRLTPFIDPYQVSALFFLTVVPYMVATVIPSWRAATVDPDAVMRS